MTRQEPGDNCSAVPGTGCTTYGFGADGRKTSMTEGIETAYGARGSTRLLARGVSGTAQTECSIALRPLARLRHAAGRYTLQLVLPESTSQLAVTPLPASCEEVGRCLWVLEDARARTKAAIAGLDAAALDWTLRRGTNSIASPLYHLAVIEADWLFVDVLRDIPADMAALLPFRDRYGP